MANIDSPNGLKPVGRDPRINYYYAGVTTAIGKGDIVQLKNSGRVKTITTTTGNAAIIGVAAEYVAASTTPSVRIAVYDDPNQEFVCQDDGAGVTTSDLNKDVVGETAVVVVNTCNTTTGISKQELDISGTGTATTDPLIVTDVYQGADNQSGVANMKWVVRLNRHKLRLPSGGI